MSTTHTRTRPPGSRPRAGSGGRPPGGPRRGGGGPPRVRSTTRRSSPVRPEEIIPRTSPDLVDGYARLFRSALVQALDRVPADGGGLMLARSRAATRTFDLTRGLMPEAAERVRTGVVTEVAAERGLVRLGGAPLSHEIPHEDRARADVPRGRPVDGARVRLGGRKR